MSSINGGAKLWSMTVINPSSSDHPPFTCVRYYSRNSFHLTPTPSPARASLRSLRATNRRWAQRADYHIGDAIRTRWLWQELDQLLPGAQRVLDAGCGAGQHTLQLATKYPSLTLIGLDNRPEPILQARAHASALGLSNVQFRVADLERPLPERDVDIVVSIDVIEHVPQDVAMLRVLGETLRPGGHLLIHTPLTPQRHYLHRFDLDQAVNELHVREGYHRGELEQKAQTAGFTSLQTIYTHGPVGTLAWEIWRLVRPWAPLKVLAWPFLTMMVNWETRAAHQFGNCILLKAQKAEPNPL